MLWWWRCGRYSSGDRPLHLLATCTGEARRGSARFKLLRRAADGRTLWPELAWPPPFGSGQQTGSSKTAPTWPHDGPSQPQDDPKTAPGHPMTASRRQDCHKAFPKTACPKPPFTPKLPNMLPRGSPAAPTPPKIGARRCYPLCGLNPPRPLLRGVRRARS